MIYDDKKSSVWHKGHSIPNRGIGWKKDDFGRVMRFKDYGNRQSEYGWEIDHIKPESKGGTDDLSNLRPLNWKSNVTR